MTPPPPPDSYGANGSNGTVGQPEDLREYYITPDYLAQMRQRAREWSDDFIRYQHRVFRKTIVDYPEVFELLEAELHRRNLNRLHKGIRRKSEAELRALKKQYTAEPDYVEVIETELEIRKGVRRLADSSDGKARIVAV
jgi:hypothetical protein